MSRRRWVIAVLLGLVGGVLGVWLLADVHANLGPVDVQARLQPALGADTQLRLGLLGEARMDTHDGLFSLVVSAQALDSRSVADVVSGAGARSVQPVDLAAARSAGARLLGLAVLGAVAGGALLAAAVLRSRRAAAAGAAAGLALCVVSAGLAVATLHDNAWRTPRLDGVIALVPSTAEQLLAGNEQLGQRLADLTGGLATLQREAVASSLRAGAGPETGTRVLVISDLHNNPAGLQLATRLAQIYHVDAVMNLGDDTDWGSALESRFLSDADRFGAPYLWVRGNHDSLQTQAAVAANGATVLDGTLVTAAGLHVYGIGDPTFTPAKTQAVIDQGETQFKEQWSASTFLPKYRADTAGRRVDVLMVHDAAMVAAFSAADLPPLVLSGHGHQFSISRRDGSTFIEMGSTGGAGLRAFDQPGDVTPLTAGILTFDPATALPLTIDVFTLQPFGDEQFSVKRYVLSRPAGS